MGQSKFYTILVISSITYFSFSQRETEMTICWDTSYSMIDRKLDKELSFLDSIIANDKIQYLRLLLFSNDIKEEFFEIEKGDWSSLKNRLSNTQYDGLTDYELLNQVTKMGKTFVFTDGNKVIGDSFLSLDKGDVLVSGTSNANIKTLKLWEFLNRSKLVDLCGDAYLGVEDRSVVKGVVYLDGQPAPNFRITSSSGKSMIADKNGFFSYLGNIGDTLRIEGREDESQLVVEDNVDEVSFILNSKTVGLDEVVVKDKLLKEAREINTAYGLADKTGIGYAISTVTDSEINDSEAKVNEALYGKTSGVQITKASGFDNRGTLGKTLVRGANSINMNNYALIVVDGVPLESNNKFNFSGSRPRLGSVRSEVQREALFDHINPDNIAEVTVLKGLAATNRFGALGANGVLMITTKTAVNKVPKNTASKTLDLPSNIFEGNLIRKKGQLDTPYLRKLKKAKNLKDAYTIYLDQRAQYKNDFWYFLDVSNFFRTANVHLADKVASNIIEIPFEYPAARTLLFKYDKEGQSKKALRLARQIAKRYPNKIQSHFDLAMAEKKTGNVQAAAKILNGILKGTANKTIDFAPLNKIASTELRNLINQYRRQLDLSQIDARYYNNLTYNTRLRFEWASPQDHFILKFVNPQNRYFDWEHDNVSNKERITTEVRHGYGAEQFEIVGDVTAGKWGVYIKNTVNSSNVFPYWVKCTLDHNFGKPNQYSEEKLIRLDSQYAKEQLFFEFTSN